MARLISTQAGGQRNPWLRAPVLVALGFLLAILAGAALLSAPAAVVPGHAPLRPLQALFTATSATCVTGLVVVDTARDLSLFGQAVVLALIQLGGLGIMTLAFLVFASLGAAAPVPGRELLASTLTDVVYRHRPRRTLLLVAGGTALVEIAGALALLPALRGEPHALGKAVFLSVSAFCNAGFDNLEGGLPAHCGSWSLGLPLLLLWLLGGTGFIVPVALAARLRRGPGQPLDLSASMILAASALLVPLGALLFFCSEGFGGLLAGRPWHEQLLLALFQGNAPRTAGFSMLDLGQAQRVTLLVQIPLMLVGGAPGGTAGGVKTTSAWVFAATLWARIVGEEDVVIHRRAVPIGAIRHAVIICVFMAVGLGTMTTLLTVFESGEMAAEALAFEAASALGTVGLSTGVTPHLSGPSQLVLILAMFVGRLGPLTFVYVFVPLRPRPRAVIFPHAEVFVG